MDEDVTFIEVVGIALHVMQDMCSLYRWIKGVGMYL